MKELRMHGRGGQGIVVGGEILSNAFLNEGKYLAVMPSYGVERRGSDVTAIMKLTSASARAAASVRMNVRKKPSI